MNRTKNAWKKWHHTRDLDVSSVNAWWERAGSMSCADARYASGFQECNTVMPCPPVKLWQPPPPPRNLLCPPGFCPRSSHFSLWYDVIENFFARQEWIEFILFVWNTVWSSKKFNKTNEFYVYVTDVITLGMYCYCNVSPIPST